MAKMHADEVDIDAALVGRLIAAQFPHWVSLPIDGVASSGTDNAMFRLGDELAVRLPRREAATKQVEKEHRWLPKLAPLPLEIPGPVAMGRPADGYPWQWSVYRWLEGENATTAQVDESRATALAIAGFVAALRRIDTAGGPGPGAHNFYRGAPLAHRDRYVRAAIASLGSEVDVAAVSAAWETALHAPEWQGAPTWIHGDLAPGNLLVREGRVRAVIDFGGLAVGDPACDLMVAWNFMTRETRDVFRHALPADESAWARGRGWALSMSLIALPYYLHTNPVIVENSRRTIAAVLSDQ
jgi:aminoglycoside phosphotransferase (APT) family kinase protein